MPSPWTAARHEFEDVYADLARGKHAWQVAAFALLALLAVLTATVVRLSLGARITPYIVEVDKLGRARAFGPAEPLRQTDARLVVSQVALFLREVRTVLPSDAAAGRRAAARVRVHRCERGDVLNAYFTDPRNNPRLLARTLARTVEITSVLPVPASMAWRAQWTETDWPLDGRPPQVVAWEGYLGVRLAPPETVDAVEDNPLGVHVTSITWTRVGGSHEMARAGGARRARHGRAGHRRPGMRSPWPRARRGPDCRRAWSMPAARSRTRSAMAMPSSPARRSGRASSRWIRTSAFWPRRLATASGGSCPRLARCPSSRSSRRSAASRATSLSPPIAGSMR